MENWLRSGSLKRTECDDTLHLGSANSAEAACESDINISGSSAIKYLVVAVQRENIFENMTRVIWNLDLLGVEMKVNQNLSVLRSALKRVYETHEIETALGNEVRKCKK